MKTTILLMTSIILISQSTGGRCSLLPPPPPPPVHTAPATHYEDVSGVIYVDNWFDFYYNGQFVAEDPVQFIPHQAVKVEFPGTHSRTGKRVYAIKAVDWADAVTGLEYNDTAIGDGGFIAMFSDGVRTNSDWKCMTVMYGPVDMSCMDGEPPYHTCTVQYYDIPTDWYALDFDDSTWPSAYQYSADEVGWGVTPSDDEGIDPQTVDWDGASFIWGEDLSQVNALLCRYTYYRYN